MVRWSTRYGGACGQADGKAVFVGARGLCVLNSTCVKARACCCSITSRSVSHKSHPHSQARHVKVGLNKQLIVFLSYCFCFSMKEVVDDEGKLVIVQVSMICEF